MLDQGLRCQHKNPQYAYIAPTYGQAKRIAWAMLKTFTDNYPGVRTNEAELKMTIDRPWLGDKVTFYLLGAEKYDSHRGIYLDGTILDEYGDCDPSVWSQVIRPTLSDRLGWAIFIGTPKGQNHFFNVYERAQGQDDWFTCVLKASETNIIPASELRAARQVMSEEEYLQEYECDFTAAMTGSYYGQQLKQAHAQGRITKVPYQTELDVHTAWDLGINDMTSIWFFQQAGREFHFIDYYENHDLGLEHYVNYLRSKDYVYGQHWLPHDVVAKELGSGKTRIETLKSLGLKHVKVAPKQRIEDGINASRIAIARSWFDDFHCSQGLACLQNYSRSWDNKEKVFSKKPKHDWASHGADAFRTFAQGYRDHFSVFKTMGNMIESEYNVLEA